MNTKNLFSIAHDHFHGLMLAQMIKRGSTTSDVMPVTLEGKAKYTVRFFEQELENHFYLEEHVLQPEVKGISPEIDAIFAKLVKEHNNIRKLAKDLKIEEDLEDKLDLFGRMLEEHITTEEKILFPKIQEVLSEHDLQQLAERLNKKGYENIFRY